MAKKIIQKEVKEVVELRPVSVIDPDIPLKKQRHLI
jgi:hypothetical protein